MNTFFKIAFFLFGVVCVAFILTNISTLDLSMTSLSSLSSLGKQTSGQILASQFETDMQKLETSGGLPQMWGSLRKVKFVPTGKTTEVWLKQAYPEIKTDENGKYNLEYVLIDDSDENNPMSVALVQMSIFDAASNNKVWEFARVYHLNGNSHAPASVPAASAPAAAPNTSDSTTE